MTNGFFTVSLDPITMMIHNHNLKLKKMLICMKKYILKTIGDRWRQHKSDLKGMYFDEKKSTEANYNNKPKSVTPDQWRYLVNHWTTEKANVLKRIPFSTFLDGLHTFLARMRSRRGSFLYL